jgi:hypothetical protein
LTKKKLFEKKINISENNIIAVQAAKVVVGYSDMVAQRNAV